MRRLRKFKYVCRSILPAPGALRQSHGSNATNGRFMPQKISSKISRWPLVCGFFLFISLLTEAPAFAGKGPAGSMMFPPEIKWEIIETPHFTILHDSSLRLLAEEYARYAESSFQLIAPVFGEWPVKTVIVIDDTTDLANGSASGVPYPTIQAYPVLPTATDPVADYGNWGFELLIHEYAHILNFEPAYGIMTPLRYTFGSIIRPNMFLPRWYSEGLAVEIETRFSSHGRLRSTNYLASIRALAEDEALKPEDIGRINEVSIPDWPGGLRPYLMGALLLDEMVRQKGVGIIKEMNLAYSSRVPFFINAPAEDRLGLNYQEILSATYVRLQSVIDKQNDLINKASQPKETPLEQSGFFNHSPTISPDGRTLAYVSKDHNQSGVKILTRTAAGSFFTEKVADTSEPLVQAMGEIDSKAKAVNRLSWFPNSKRLVHDGADTHNRLYFYSDLWVWDVEKKSQARLTRGLRAREPVVTPNGKAIVFVQNVPGSTQLAAIDQNGKNLRVLYKPPFQTRVSRPEFLDEDRIVFAERDGRSGKEILKVVKVKSDTLGLPRAIALPESVLLDYQPAHDPRRSKEGLLFVSERSGIANIYLADANLGTVRAASNTTTRLMTPELDSQTGALYFSRLYSDGPKIAMSAANEWKKREANPPSVESILDTDWNSSAAPSQISNEKTSPAPNPLKHQSYSALPYMLPRYWMPYVFVTPNSTMLQASTGSSDPAMRHAYSLLFSYDTVARGMSGIGSYLNQTTAIPIEISGGSLTNYILNANIKTETAIARVTGSFFLPSLTNDWSGALGWELLSTQSSNTKIERSGPVARLLYNNTKQSGEEISPESGQSFFVEHSHYLPGLSTTEYDLTDLHVGTYFGKGWLPERHVLALFGKASIAPRLNYSPFGVYSQNTSYQNLPGTRTVVMRGYNTGVFIGRNLWAATAEYRFPVRYAYQSFGTRPFFLRKWHADIFIDALTLDGLAYDYTASAYSREKIGRFYYGTGGELKMDATIFYHVPLQLVFGLYYGLDPKANNIGLFPVISVGI